MGLLEGRVAVVSGAGRGLGRSHAIALAAAGARVVVNDVVWLACELSGDLTSRVLRVDGPHVCEARLTLSEGLRAERWTPQALTARIGEIVGA